MHNNWEILDLLYDGTIDRELSNYMRRDSFDNYNIVPFFLAVYVESDRSSRGFVRLLIFRLPFKDWSNIDFIKLLENGLPKLLSCEADGFRRR